MVGMFLKERDVQYVAHRDDKTQTWRILDTWHQDLANLGPEDEIEDTSGAVTILTEGAFIALVKEAARLGTLQNAAFENNSALEEENHTLRERLLELEKSLHKFFKYYRIRENGEWFQFEDTKISEWLRTEFQDFASQL